MFTNIHVIHSSIPFVHRNVIVMLAHPAGDDVTTSITLSRFSVSYLPIARQFLLFCSATSENSKENKNRDIEVDFYNYEITSARGSHFEKMFGKTADKIETSTY